MLLEKVIDTFFFHQSGNKVEISLPVLHTVVALAEGAVEPEFEVAKAELCENRLNNVGDGLLLEDAAVRLARQEPQPGNHFGSIISKAPIRAALGEPADEAVEITEGILGLQMNS